MTSRRRHVEYWERKYTGPPRPEPPPMSPRARLVSIAILAAIATIAALVFLP